jgi:hypothetical protein
MLDSMSAWPVTEPAWSQPVIATPGRVPVMVSSSRRVLSWASVELVGGGVEGGLVAWERFAFGEVLAEPAVGRRGGPGQASSGLAT